MQIKFNLPEIMWRLLSKVKLNDRNPRKINDNKFETLKKNIEKFPKMMGIRPVVIDQDSVIMGGNMRFRACLDLGWKEIPVIMFDESWTKEEMKMFVVVDNQGYGVWDYEILGADYDMEELENYGLDLNYNINPSEIDVEAEWEGMPEVNAQRVEGAVQSIVIHFETAEDVIKFAEITELKLTDKTKFAWFPFREQQKNKDFIVENES